MSRWKWVVRCTYNDTVKPPKKPGELAIETVHTDDHSKDLEVRVSKARGDVNVEVFPYLETTTERKPKDCPTCNGWVLINDRWVKHRVTKRGICESCGKDYFAVEK